MPQVASYSLKKFAPGDSLLGVTEAGAVKRFPTAGSINLTEDTTYYIRTDGDDSNAGLTNDSAGAFASLTGALTYIANNVDACGHYVTLQIADGTYIEPDDYILPMFTGIAALSILGNPANNRAVKITSSTAGIMFTWFSMVSTIYVSDIEFSNTNPVAAGVFALNAGSQLVLNNIYWGTMGGGYCVWIASCANCELTGIHTVATGPDGDYWGLASDNAFLSLEPGTAMTVSGTPNFAAAFIWVNRGAVFAIEGATLSGAATGTRWVLGSGGIIDTGLGGVTGSKDQIPGNSAGINIDGTGIYV